MDNFPNISTTFSEAKEELGLSLKEMGDLVTDLKAKYGDIPEACLMCESSAKRLRDHIEEATPKPRQSWGIGVVGVHLSSALGINIYVVDDEDADLIPEFGTENILIGSRLQIWKLLQYVNLLKERVGR